MKLKNAYSDLLNRKSEYAFFLEKAHTFKIYARTNAPSI